MSNTSNAKERRSRRRAATGSLYVGTSGWNYKHWQGPFYDESLPRNKWLEHYARSFRTVEINNSFYQLPDKKTVRQWRDTVSRDFIFAIKASRYITHMKKLKDPRESLQKFLAVADELEHRLGPILFQLPPRWRLNIDRLHEFLGALPDGRRCAFEFRDNSWWADDVYELLRDFGTAFCMYDLKRRLTPKEITADFIYIRLHGPSSQAYRGSYDRRRLSGWAGAISSWRSHGLDVYCYFDNDQDGYAAANALQLQNML